MSLALPVFRLDRSRSWSLELLFPVSIQAGGCSNPPGTSLEGRRGAAAGERWHPPPGRGPLCSPVAPSPPVRGVRVERTEQTCNSTARAGSGGLFSGLGRSIDLRIIKSLALSNSSLQ